MSRPDVGGSALSKWVEYSAQRDMMLRRLSNCALASWLTVLTVSILSGLMTWHFETSTVEVMEIFQTGTPESGAHSGDALQAVMIFLSICVLWGLLPIAWKLNLIPFFRKLRNDIDWTTIGHAMSHLLPLGIPYPTAFRLTAKNLCCASHRQWLEQAATSVEAGQQAIKEVSFSRPDEAVFQTIMSHPDSMAHQDWEAVAHHYDACAKRTWSLLVASVPVASTLLAGLILWLAITSTFGDFYRALTNGIQQFGF
ncbi:MAG: hypothetical protein ACPGPS_21180 [Rubripirellula sp.]